MNKTQKGISTKINNSKNLNLIINSDTYKLAHEDIGLLKRNEMRGVRMLLEITKPDLILEAVSYTHLTLPTNREV